MTRTRELNMEKELKVAAEKKKEGDKREASAKKDGNLVGAAVKDNEDMDDGVRNGIPDLLDRYW